MTNRQFMIAILAVGLLALVVVFATRQPARVPRVGFLGMDSVMQAPRIAGFREGMRKQGYVEGTNVTIVERWADGGFERLPGAARELVGRNIDVLVTAAPPAVRAAQQATDRIPIVMIVHDPVGQGFASSLARPGGNLTGIAFQDAEFSTKRLELLRRAVPDLKRIAILWNKEGGGLVAVSAVERAASTMGIDTRAWEVHETGDFAPTIGAAKAWGAQGLIQLASPFITRNRRILIDLLAANRMPATCELREYVVDGCLMTYSADLNAMFARLASFVKRILDGAKPADLPIEQPREFEFVINLKTAQLLGLDVAPQLLLEATEVIR